MDPSKCPECNGAGWIKTDSIIEMDQLVLMGKHRDAPYEEMYTIMTVTCEACKGEGTTSNE